MRRFLFVTVDAPRDGGSGGQIVSYRLLRAYSELGAVDVIALSPPGVVPAPELEARADRIAFVPIPHFHYSAARARNALLLGAAVARGIPFRALKFRSGRARKRIATWARERRYDLVHCDHLSTAPYRALLPGAPALLAEHNVEWQQFSQLAGARRNPIVARALASDSRRTRGWEASSLERFDHALTLSEHDRALLLDERPDLEGRISVWPVPVDPVAPIGRAPGPPAFLVLGSLRSIGRAHGLRWLLDEVWPDVRSRVPDARLEIVGADPPDDVRGRDGSSGIRVRGFVEDLEPLLATVDACVIPLFVGAGIRVKVLELIARGIPCVGTPLALQGLAPLEGCTQEANADGWAAALTRLAADPAGSRAAALRGAGRLEVEHASNRSRARLKEILDSVARERTASGEAAGCL